MIAAYILLGISLVVLIWAIVKVGQTLPQDIENEQRRRHQENLRKLEEEDEKKRQDALRKQQEVAQYRELFEMGALTREEFEAKKKQILG